MENLQKHRTRFILISMPISIVCLAIAAYTHSGPMGGALWSYGFAFAYGAWAVYTKDKILQQFLLFALAAGFTELLADAWIEGTNTLFYPKDEPMLYRSPMYMPFSWVVVLIQLGYIGYLIHKKWGLLPAIGLVGAMGCMIIPFYEFLAIHAGWWHYENAPMWGLVPKFIYLAEGILMLSIPMLFDQSAQSSKMKAVFLGVVQGLVMLAASIVAFALIGH
jgi:hypothetical protein